MQQEPLDYFSQAEGMPPLTRAEKVGRSLAITSLVLPFFTFILTMGLVGLAGQEGAWVGYLLMALLALSCLLGLVALCGMHWWGNQGIWAMAVLGIAFSVSYFLMAKWGGP